MTASVSPPPSPDAVPAVADVVRAIPAGIAVLQGPQHTYQHVNTNYSALIGNRDVVGVPVAVAVPEVVEQGFIDLLDRVYRTGIPYVGRDTLVRLDTRGDGVLRDTFLDFTYAATHDSAGVINGIVIYVVDVTAAYYARAQASKLQSDIVDQRADLEVLFTSVPAAIAVLRGPDHVISLINDAYSKLVGHRDVIGKPVADALPEAQGQGLVAQLNNVYRTGRAFVGHEAVFRLEDGHGGFADAYVDFSYLATRNTDGEIDGVLAHIVDVTEAVLQRRLTDKLVSDLQVQRASLEALIEQLPAGVVLSDTTGALVQANSSFREFFEPPGGRVDSIQAWAAMGAFRPDGSACTAEDFPLARSLRTGEAVIQEPLEFQKHGGNVHSVEISTRPIFDDNGKIASAVAVVADVTQRRQAEISAASRRAAQQFQAHMDQVFEATGDGICVLDREGQTILINPAGQLLTGHAPAEILGKDSHLLIHHTHPDGSPYVEAECPIVASATVGSIASEDTEVFWRKDGTSFPVSYRATPIYDEGEHVGAVLVFRDLTEERLAEAAARQARDADISAQRAFEVNDSIVQRLAVADFAFGMGETQLAAESVRDALAMARKIISSWADEGGASFTLSEAGDETQ